MRPHLMDMGDNAIVGLFGWGNIRPKFFCAAKRFLRAKHLLS